MRTHALVTLVPVARGVRHCVVCRLCKARSRTFPAITRSTRQSLPRGDRQTSPRWKRSAGVGVGSVINLLQLGGHGA